MTIDAAQKRLRDQRTIIEKTLSLAVFDGLSDDVIAKAAVAKGYDAPTARRLFPGGVIELLSQYSAQLNTDLVALAQTQADTLDAMRMHERIGWLVRERLQLAVQHKEALRLAAAHTALPWNQPTLMRNIWNVCDTIWHIAGDTSLDFNYYSKRALLSKVYISTSMVWMNDDSDDHVESWEFMERRIAGVLRLGKHIGQTKSRITGSVENAMDGLLNRSRYKTKRR